MPHYDTTDVFTPAGVPTVTYVYRGEQDLETQLRRALKTPGLIISLSGPSKSGKTVLIKKVIPEENLIPISGGSIRSAEMLWDRVLNWMQAPSETTAKTGTTVGAGVSAKAGGKAGIPLVAHGSVEASGSGSLSRASETSAKTARGGIDQVVREIAGSSFTVFIDDYHYMQRDVQEDVARQIKEAAEKGVQICTASVPHRADDVVRSNPELRGRVQAIDFEYWSPQEVVKIAEAGFPALGVRLPRHIHEVMAGEAFGSPQLMQAICLQTCFHLDVESPRDPEIAPTLEQINIRRVLEHTAATTDFSTLLDALHAGPKLRGQDRNQFQFTDGSVGDVYRCVLLALAADPPRLSFRYDEIYKRTRDVCRDSAPGGSSVKEALAQMGTIASTVQAFSPVVEWSDDVLDIADPYFLFYLRASSRLAKIQRRDEGQSTLAV
jgi:hypothetical protein